MSDIKITNVQGVEEVVDSRAFELCQENVVLHDVKFETKTTTYAKDAFKRFCKNKSSIVAAIIIGILFILAFSVPIFSQHDLETPHLTQRLLSPRIFKAGTGFWDGTKKYENIIYDPAATPVAEAPAGFKKNAIVKIYELKEVTLDDFSEYSHGGIFIFEANKMRREEGNYTFDYVKHATAITFTKENGISVAVKFFDESEYQTELSKMPEYRIVLQTNAKDVTQYVVLRDWTTNVEDFEYDISQYLIDNDIDSITGSVRFDIKANAKPPYGALYIESFNYTSTLDPEAEENAEFLALLDAINLNDANGKKLLATSDPGYWHSSGTMRVIKTAVTYCTFLYDHYEDQLGTSSNYEIGRSIMEQYIRDGLCTYDFNVGPESFVSLSERCPIDRVNLQKSTMINGKEVINLSCDVQIYKVLGFKTMPKFILGTDASGFD